MDDQQRLSAQKVAEQPGTSSRTTSSAPSLPRPQQSHRSQQTKKEKTTDFDSDIDPTDLSPDDFAAYLGVSRPPTPTFEELLDLELPPVPRCPIPPLPFLPASAFEEEIGNASNESIASVEALSKAVPRNLLFPRYHRGLSRIEYLAPDHEVRITENCGEGFFSSYIGAVCAAVDGIGWPYSLRRQVRKELNSAQWRADFLQAGGSQQEYEDYMEGIADPGWWGDRQSLLVLRHRCGHPIVVVTERAKWLEVEWADEADREKFERGELDEVVLGIWREGNVHEIMY